MATHSSTLPGKSHGQRSMVGYSPWGHKELNMTERLHFHFHLIAYKASALVCMLSYFSCAQLFVTLGTIAHQASLSMGPTLFDPMGYSLPGSSVCGIFQERILEWVAISSSGHLLHPDAEPVSPVSPALADGFFNTEPPGKLTLWLGLGQKLLDFYENHLRSFVKLDSQIEGDLKVLWLSHSTLSPTSFDSWLLLCNILARWLA